MTIPVLSPCTVLHAGSTAIPGYHRLRVADPAATFLTPVTGDVIPCQDQPAPSSGPEAIVRRMT